MRDIFSGEPLQMVMKLPTTFIPFDTANRDAVEFAKWLQDGGIPEPATEGEVVTQEWINVTIAKLLPEGNNAV
jgi:hypothetical protein